MNDDGAIHLILELLSRPRGNVGLAIHDERRRRHRRDVGIGSGIGGAKREVKKHQGNSHQEEGAPENAFGVAAKGAVFFTGKPSRGR